MRVLHVSAYYAPAFVYGGPPRSVHGLCRALGQHGAAVDVFTTDANGAGGLPQEVTGGEKFDGVAVRYFPRTWPREPIGSRALIRALHDILPRVDLVHVHGLWNRVVWGATREARRAGVPYVLSPRGMLEDAALAHRAWRKRLAYAAVERHTLDGAAWLHATSRRERDTLQALRPCAPVVLIPNGVELYAEPAGHRGSVTAPPVFVFVGRIHAIKRLDLLLDAFAIAREAHRDARLVIAGPDEQGLRTILQNRRPGIREAVTWTGAVDAARRDALLASARALVLCSDSESFGMSVVEAMAMSTPVVVTRTCGWEDVEQHGAGFVVAQQPEAIAEALTRLIDAPVLAAEMGRRGRALVEQSYTWNAVAESFLRTYGSVVSRRGGVPAIH